MAKKIKLGQLNPDGKTWTAPAEDLPQSVQDPNISTITGRKIDSTVKFNSDGSVTVGDGTKTVNLSKEEYNATLPSRQPQGVQETPQLLEAEKMKAATEQKLISEKLNPTVQPTAEQAAAVESLNQPLGDVAAPQDGKTGDKAVNLLTNAASIGAGASSGAALGAAAGSVVPGLGTAAGALIGGIIGGAGTLFAKVSLDERQNTKEAYTNYKNAVKAQKATLNAINAGQITPEVAAQAWAIQQRNLLIARAQLKEKTDNALGRQLSNAMDEYSTVDDYINYQQPFMTASLQKAILKPNPGAFIPLDDYETQD